MAFWSKSGQTMPLGGSVTQEVISDGSGNIRPLQYNESNSGGSRYAAISTATTTVVSNSPGRLCRIHVPGTGGTPGNITIYDNASAGSGQVLYGPTTPSAGQIIDIQAPVQSGITVVTASAMVCYVTYEALV